MAAPLKFTLPSDGTLQRRSANTGLARALSKLGYCSRAQAARLIREGKVRVNGGLRRDPQTPVHIGKDRIEIEGQRVASAPKIYLMLNKPRGMVTSASDEKGRDTVYALLNTDLPWVAPVGRLDKASEGLLLMTNDTEWAARVTDPETQLEKTYHVQIETIADSPLIRTLHAGVRTSDGQLLRAKRTSLLRHGGRNSWVEIVLDEGKNRHIRRMLDGLGVKVLRLVRIAIGPVALSDLPKGSVRRLTPEEKLAVDLGIRKASGV